MQTEGAPVSSNLGWDSPTSDAASSQSAFNTRTSHTQSTHPDETRASLEDATPTTGTVKQLGGVPLRSSIDSNGSGYGIQPRPSHWQDAASIDGADTVASGRGDAPSLVDTGFDENILRALCDIDCGTPLLLDRIKQSTTSCREAAIFLRKRAAIEEEYGRGLQKLAKLSSELYSTSGGKSGTFVHSWHHQLKIHEGVAENRLRFAARLVEMSDELGGLIKEVEKNRKTAKDLSTRYEKALQDSEIVTDKNKNRLDQTSEELERVLLQKEGESLKDSGVQNRNPAGGKRVFQAVAKGGLLLKGKNPGNLQRQEGDIRSRMSQASDAYRKAVTETQASRQEYFNFQLPRILRSLKECLDEVDLGTQYHLIRYAFLFESILMSDGNTLSPSDEEESKGLKATMEDVDNRGDFKVFMQNYSYARIGTAPRGPRREGPADEGFLPPIAAHNEKFLATPQTTGNAPAQSPTPSVLGKNTFGVDLGEQMMRDGVEVPPILQKCCQIIEQYGISSQGIYRINGTQRKVQALREKLEKDVANFNLDTEEWTSDINNVTSVIKQWLRELPDPVMTFALHYDFVDAAKIDNDRLRHIRLHERVNDLPDPNYATLKYFLGHLHRISQRSSENSMTVQNLAIVFGPTLFGIMAPTTDQNGQMNGGMADAAHQNKAVETILEHYTDIFVDEAS